MAAYLKELHKKDQLRPMFDLPCFGDGIKEVYGLLSIFTSSAKDKEITQMIENVD